MGVSTELSRSHRWRALACFCGILMGLAASVQANPLGAVLTVPRSSQSDEDLIKSLNGLLTVSRLHYSDTLQVATFSFVPSSTLTGASVQVKVPPLWLNSILQMNPTPPVQRIDSSTVGVTPSLQNYTPGPSGTGFFLIPLNLWDTFTSVYGYPYWQHVVHLTQDMELMGYNQPYPAQIATAPIAGINVQLLNTGTTSPPNAVATVPEALVVSPGTQQPTGLSFHLTDSEPNETRAVWFPDRQYIAGGFVTTFQFQIADPLSWQAGVTPGGDGFAFVVQNYRQQPVGPGGGFLGYNGIPDSLAVEFDTYWNKDDFFFDPYVGRYVPIDDPDGNHISVHTRGTAPNSVSELNSIGRVSPATNLKDGARHFVQILYQPGALSIFLDDLQFPVLTVTRGPDGSSLDLARLLALSDGRAWFGFTAGTGAASENLDIFSWDFRVFSNPP